MRTFLLPGPAIQFEMQKIDKASSIAGVLIQCNQKKLIQLQNQYHDYRIWNLKQLRNPILGVEEKADSRRYDEVMHKLLSDPRTFYLAERVLGNNLWKSVFNHTITIEILVNNCLNIIEHTKPDCLLICASPHSIETWVLSICFEVLNLKVYIMESSPLLWRTWLYEGIDKQHVVKINHLNHKDYKLTNWTREFVKSQQAFDKPSNGERRNMNELLSSQNQSKLYNGHWWSWRKELSRALVINKMLPERLAEIWLKKKLLNSYNSLAINEYPPKPFITFFMHYQPERTSLPEGLWFSQQWLAIRALAASLPSGWILLVREHPSTWWRSLMAKVRSPDLYDRINKLSNVKIASMNLTTFGLIDNSEAVSTLTGKVGFQAILRNKPVIFFGVPGYKNAPGAFFVSGLNEASEVMIRVSRSHAINLNHKKLVEDYLLWIEENTVTCESAFTDVGSVENLVAKYIPECRYNSFRIITEWFLSLDCIPDLAECKFQDSK